MAKRKLLPSMEIPQEIPHDVSCPPLYGLSEDEQGNTACNVCKHRGFLCDNNPCMFWISLRLQKWSTYRTMSINAMRDSEDKHVDVYVKKL